MIGIVNDKNNNLYFGAKEKIRTLKPKVYFVFPFIFIFKNKQAHRGGMGCDSNTKVYNKFHSKVMVIF